MNTIKKIVDLHVTPSENKNSKFYITVHDKIIYNPNGSIPNDDFFEFCDIHLTYSSSDISQNDKFIFSHEIDTFNEKLNYIDNVFAKIIASTDESLGLPGFHDLCDLRFFASWNDATPIFSEFNYTKKCVKCKNLMEDSVCKCGEEYNYFYSFKIHTINNKVKISGPI